MEGETDNYVEWGFGNINEKEEVDLNKATYKPFTGGAGPSVAGHGKEELFSDNVQNHPNRVLDEEKVEDIDNIGYVQQTDPVINMELNSVILHWKWLMSRMGIMKEPSQLKREDLMNKEFESLEDAEKFFHAYANCIGFSVRKGHKRKKLNGEVVMREWLCSREGTRRRQFMLRKDRIREPKAITRVQCKVLFRVGKSKQTKQWSVKEFITKHSHDKVPFIKQDLYNRIGSYEHVELSDADASRAMGYLHHKADHDAQFYGKYSFDEYFRLKNVVWADSRCQTDYSCFGHALAFDTTYRTNSCGKPLLVFAGINHHFKTVVLGFALMIDETIESYRWVIQSFLECMNGIQPEIVITDGDKAMRAAIAEFMPNAKHRLCSWHIKTNAIKNVKDANFTQRLERVMFRYYTEEQFELEWESMINDFGLTDNNWASDLYERRRSWAETYLRDHFFGGMSTTQRCESMNSFLLKNVDERMKLWEFVRKIDIALSSLRHTESKDDYDTTNATPMLSSTNMRTVEEQAAQIYTRAMFFEVRDEIKKEGKYMVSSKVDEASFITCFLTKYCDESYHRRVKLDKLSEQFSCKCNLFPTKGIACRHIFSTMKALHFKRIPDSLILNRWTMNAKGVGLKNKAFAPNCKYTCAEESARFGHVNNRASELSFYASKNDEVFKLVNQVLDDAIAVSRSAWEGYVDDVSNKRRNVTPDITVRNPVFTKTKGTGPPRIGTARGSRKCSVCNKKGHNKTTCKRRMKSNYDASPIKLSPSIVHGSTINLDDDTDIWFDKNENGNGSTDINFENSSDCDTNFINEGRKGTHAFGKHFFSNKMGENMAGYDVQDYPIDEADEGDWWGTPTNER